jgi:hypothetical protein
MILALCGTQTTLCHQTRPPSLAIPKARYSRFARLALNISKNFTAAELQRGVNVPDALIPGFAICFADVFGQSKFSLRKL